jgi:hypothetical protein
MIGAALTKSPSGALWYNFLYSSMNRFADDTEPNTSSICFMHSVKSSAAIRVPAELGFSRVSRRTAKPRNLNSGADERN